MTIESKAFSSCGALAEIIVPNSVTSFGSSVFSSCTSLNRATLPNSLTSIPNYTFNKCSSLTSVSIPNSAKSIGQEAFFECSSLTSVSIPNSVNSIGASAFSSCGITEITIPAAVNSIGNYAFHKCLNLNTIKVDPANTVYDSRNNCNALMNTSTNTLIAGCNSTIIPNDCQTIGEYAFYYSTIKNLTIPASVTTINNYAFYFANDLSMITFLGQTAPTFSYYSFYQAYGGVAVIPSGCLANYSSWTTTTSGNGSLGSNHWNFVEDGQYFKENGIVYSLDGTTVIGHDGTIPESVTIREGVTTISQYAFDYWKYLKNITLPASVTSIASLAFLCCTGIKSVTSLAVTAPSITSSSFYQCSQNVEIRVPKGSAGSYSNSWMQTGNSYPGDLHWTIVEF